MPNRNFIDSYSFGSIIIGGKKYQNDVIVFPDKTRENWWRKEGHLLSLGDLREVIDFKPEVLIIGKGAYGVMDIPRDTREKIEKMGMELIVEKTRKATELFNKKLKEGKKVVGAFHLTC